MKRKVYINADLVEVKKDTVTARELIALTERVGDDYKLELRDGDGGPVVKEFEGDDLIDLDDVCGRQGGPGQTATSAGDGGGSRQGGPRQTATSAGDGGGSRQGGPRQTATSAGDGGGTGTGTNGSGQNGKMPTAADSTPCYFTTSYTKPINAA